MTLCPQSWAPPRNLARVISTLPPKLDVLFHLGVLPFLPHPTPPGWIALVTASVLDSKACQKVADSACGSQELEPARLPSLGLPAPACPPCFEQKPLAELPLFILRMMILV